MNGHDAPSADKEEEDPGVELSNMPQLEKLVSDCLGERRAVVPPTPQFHQAGHHGGMIVGIALSQILKEIQNRALTTLTQIEFYGEFLGRSTPNLV